MLQLLHHGASENARPEAPTENQPTRQPAYPTCGATRSEHVIPTHADQQERASEPDFPVERHTTEAPRAPKQWRHSLGKLDDIEPKRWAEQGVKPIRNVPKEFQAQYREILSDLLGDHAETVRLSDLVNQRRLEKVLILLQILLHSPPERSGIPGENPSTAKARLAKHLHARYHTFDLGDFEAPDPTKQIDGNTVTRRRLAGGSPPEANQTIQADLVIEAVRAGNLGKAITMIDSNGVAPITQEVFEQIGALLNPQEPRPINVCIADHARQSPNLRNTEVAAMLRKAPTRSARDAYGWTYEHLQQLLGHSQGLTGLKEFLNRLNGWGCHKRNDHGP